MYSASARRSERVVSPAARLNSAAAVEEIFLPCKDAPLAIIGVAAQMAAGVLVDEFLVGHGGGEFLAHLLLAQALQDQARGGHDSGVAGRVRWSRAVSTLPAV